MASAAPSVVLVTGVSRYLGARLAARLGDDPRIARVLAVDTVAPAHTGVTLGAAEFVRADLGHPLIATVLDQARVDTIVHAGCAPDAVDAALIDQTAALLDACASVRSIARVVALSSTDVYGASRRDPAVFGEQMQPASELPPGPARAAADLETCVRTFARRRRDVVVSTPRLAPLVGPGVDSWFMRYVRRAWAPTAVGFDPCLQVLHEHDAVEAVACLARGQVDGPVNVAGAGVVTLTQALRIAGAVPVPLPSRVAPAGQAALLRYGRVVDTVRLVDEVGYRPRYTTVEALHASVAGHRRAPAVAAAALAGALTGALTGAQRLAGAR
jgi:UDP-glucose 4-epimerase